LVRDVRAAGIDVRVRVQGERFPLPPGLDLTAYRIVQEALTNVLKHAGARRVEVMLTYRNAQLEVAVSDDGRGEPHASTSGAGHGLLGMRERATVFGGQVSAGVRPEGGWRVHARLPVSAEA
jgi:signal transduction histidine kinase